MQNKQNGFKINLAGNTVFVRWGIEELSKLWFHWQEDRHSSAEYEIHIILRGASQVDVQNKTYLLVEEQALLIPPNQHHNAYSLPGEFLRFSVPFFLPKGPFSQKFQQQFPESYEFGVTPEIVHTCNRIITEYTCKMSYWQDLYPNLLSELMAYLFRALCPTLDLFRESPANNSNGKEFVRTALIADYLSNNLMHDVKLEDLSSMLHISLRQTRRVLQENFGMNFRQLMLNARMDRAAWLLRTTTFSMSKLIGEVGYTSEAAFYQTFRKYFKISPLQYRQQFKNSVPSDTRQ